MSNARSKFLTPEQVLSRRQRRQETKARRSARRQAIHDWLEERRIQAQKAKAARQKERAERVPTGSQRVPAFVNGNPLQRAPRNDDRQKGVVQIGSGFTRGPRPVMRQRPPRRRELTDRAMAKMTEKELGAFNDARAKSAKRLGRDLTPREETALAYDTMNANWAPAGAR